MEPEASAEEARSPSAEEEAAGPGDFVMETLQVIKYGAKNWVPKQKDENGTTWIYLAKWDRHFVHFVHGKFLDLSKKNRDGVSVDSQFFDDMLANRQTAFNGAMQERLRDEDEEQAPRAKKQKVVKATPSKHASLAPHHVSMQLPPVDGIEHACKVLWLGMGTKGIWLEFSADVVRHVRKGLQKSVARRRQPKAKSCQAKAKTRQSKATPATVNE